MGCIGKCCFGITAAVGIVAVILGVSLGMKKYMIYKTLNIGKIQFQDGELDLLL